MNQRNLYQVLGVTRSASSTEIRAAFVRLAKHHHPDHLRNMSELPGRLREVQLAYRCLSNGIARVAHDKALEESERLHFARQRRIRHRLKRYDRNHHPQPSQLDQTRGRRKVRWRSLLVAIVIAIVLARML